MGSVTPQKRTSSTQLTHTGYKQLKKKKSIILSYLEKTFEQKKHQKIKQTHTKPNGILGNGGYFSKKKTPQHTIKRRLIQKNDQK